MSAAQDLRALAVAAACVSFASGATARTQPAVPPTDHADTQLMQDVLPIACGSYEPQGLDGFVRRHAGPGYDRTRLLMAGWQRRFDTSRGRLQVDRIAPRGTLFHVTVQLAAPAGQPYLLLTTHNDCSVRSARRLRYSVSGKPAALDYLDKAMERIEQTIPLNPPIPDAPPPRGVRVALVDTGVNYLLPLIRARLARAPSGAPLGFDYWDMDARPFDAHPYRSAFQVERHGTRIASRLLRDAPNATLVPYRYPRPDMTRMRALVDHASAHDVRIVNISLVSNRERDWRPFADAARTHPRMLFIAAAGNNRRDIGETAFFPASFPLDNMLVVTSSTADGELGRNVNWGASHVDLMVAAEGVEATDFDGSTRRFSGSSYAAARVSALAACLLAENPEWHASRLRAEIVERASAVPRASWVRYGFLPDSTVARCAER